ncbi:hypothetical protein [Pseudonocardia kunmingensis]|uniref:Uncharacterized protein n=1 Tax=Pseudonocardia kunmingensis TaxID=630975 RepID=A0A543D0L4_9PSEU|nr:hypothetical protein [Pseudonocardia kunmingensis]TQM02867.1 hypothetical protein FB558_7510 [Pseudonocardia kunmingensis]
MTGSSTVVRVRPRPAMGPWIPAAAARVALGVVGVLLCLERLPPGFVLVAGLGLLGAAVAVPRWATAWVLLLLLAGTQLRELPSAQDGRFYLLLAGLHLVHVLAAQALALPWRGRVQLAVLRRPLLRFVAVQVPVQATAFAALALLAPGPDGAAPFVLPVAGVAGGAALVAVTVVLIVPLLRERIAGPGDS